MELVRLAEVRLGFTAGGFAYFPVGQLDLELKHHKSLRRVRLGPPLLPVYFITLSFNLRSQISPGRRSVPSVSLHCDFADVGHRLTMQEQNQTLEAMPVLSNMQLTIGL